VFHLNMEMSSSGAGQRVVIITVY